jgi:hypothetical protein
MAEDTHNDARGPYSDSNWAETRSSDPLTWHPRTVALTELPTLGKEGLYVSTALLHDGSAFETKVFGFDEGTGLPWDYEIRVKWRDQAMVNHCHAVDRLRTGKTLVPPKNRDT